MAERQDWQIRYRLRGTRDPHQWLVTWHSGILGKEIFGDLIKHLEKIHPDWEVALFHNGEIVEE